jgi:hypothetical protein
MTNALENKRLIKTLQVKQTPRCRHKTSRQNWMRHADPVIDWRSDTMRLRGYAKDGVNWGT